jgi:hypothetical protein
MTTSNIVETIHRFELKMSSGQRILFLDDDLERGREFTASCPEAVWVETAADCIESLKDSWDEIHLDHDLGGERFVDHDRDDCGMAVVRWLCEEPRAHLQSSLFVIHTHNAGAAMAMVFQLQSMGYRVQERRFGKPAPAPEQKRSRSAWFMGFRKLLNHLLAR